jgi:serine/threonine-protein kinase
MGLILYEPIPKPTSFNPELPPGIDAWWERAAARDREQRFQSAKEMADQLGEVLGLGVTIRVTTVRPTHRGSYPSINEQSGVIYAAAHPTPGDALCRTGVEPIQRSGLHLGPGSRPKVTWLPFAVAAVLLIISAAILGVWIKSRSVYTGPSSHASSMPRAREEGGASGSQTISNQTKAAEPRTPESLPMAMPDVPSEGSAGVNGTTGADSPIPNRADKRVPLRNHTPPRHSARRRDYGI